MRRTLVIFAAFLLFYAGVYTALETSKPTQAQATFAPFQCNSSVPISISANTQLVTAGNANMFIYVCAYNLSNNNAAAQAVSLVEGTGVTCATNTKAVVGNTTAAGGLDLAIAGSVNVGGGVGWVAKTAVAGDNLCLFVGAGPIGGVIAVGQQPF